MDATITAQLDQLAKATTVAFGGVGITGARLPATDAYFALEERLAAHEGVRRGDSRPRGGAGD